MILLIAALLVADPAASATPTPPVDHAQADYDRAEQLYQESCSDRAYGSYDDLCDQLKTQVSAYRAQLDRARRSAGARPTKVSTPPKP